MRTAVVVLAAVTLVGSALPAQAERVVFIGMLVYTAASGCAYPNYVGEQFVSRYHLSKLGSNPNTTAINNFRPTGAEGYELSPGRFTRSFQNVAATAIYNFPFSFSAQVRLTSSNPSNANITPKTNAISITGQIKNPNDDNGLSCVVTFRASYTRRVE